MNYNSISFASNNIFSASGALNDPKFRIPFGILGKIKSDDEICSKLHANMMLLLGL